MSRLDNLRRGKDLAIRRLDKEEARIKKACKHPLRSLVISEGATCSYFPGRREQSMDIKCTHCNSFFSRQLVIHDD